VPQLRLRVAFQTRFFGHRGGGTIAALYVPATRTIYLNLNRLANAGLPAFIDTVEHELWHHLVPVIPGGSRNVWWEGFNEALTESWRARLETAAGGLKALNDESVEYPVQTAFASLLLASDRARVLAYLTAADSGVPGVSASALPLLAAAERVTASEERRIAAILTDWGWKEDDGSRVSVSYLLRDRALDPEVVGREFRTNRRFLRAFTDALTVAAIQDFRRESGGSADRVADQPGLAPPLRRNLRRVLDYVGTPAIPLPGL